jgi:hypothetical protein
VSSKDFSSIYISESVNELEAVICTYVLVGFWESIGMLNITVGGHDCNSEGEKLEVCEMFWD